MSKDSMKPVRAEDIFYINDIIYIVSESVLCLYLSETSFHILMEIIGIKSFINYNKISLIL